MLFKTSATTGKRELQVRPLLAIVFAIGATAGFFFKLVPVDGYMTLVTMAVSWYFAKRNDEDETPKPPNPNPSL